MDTDLETLATALYATADELLNSHPEIVPPRPRVGIALAIADAEVLTLAAIATLVGIDTERCFLRYARRHLTGMFPYIPGQSGYNKRLRALSGTIGWCSGHRQRLHRQRAPGRLSPIELRPLPAYRATLGPGRLGRLRVARCMRS